MNEIIRKKEIFRVFRIVVAAVIVKDKSILLLKRRKDEAFPGICKFPSGKREFDESSIEALIREVKEETSLSIIVGKPIYVFEYIVKRPNEIQDVTQINFLSRLANPNQELRINKEEHEEARWFTKEEIISLKEISEEVRNCAIMALESLS
jgi:ADP-ribose pyrophosphatase YjhB (NUDIX family)